MCRECSPDWDDRKYYTKLAYKKLGKKAGEIWLWEYTPFPVSLPTWDQIAEALT